MGLGKRSPLPRRGPPSGPERGGRRGPIHARPPGGLPDPSRANPPRLRRRFPRPPAAASARPGSAATASSAAPLPPGLSRPCPPAWAARTGGEGPAPREGLAPLGAGYSPERPAGPGARRQRGRASGQKPSEEQRAPLASAGRSPSVFSNPRVLTRPRLLPPPGNQGPSPAAPRSRDRDPQPRAAREAGAAAAGPAPGSPRAPGAEDGERRALHPGPYTAGCWVRP